MHEHFIDMFSTSEFGIRFREYNRLDELGGPATMATPAPAAPAPAVSDLEAEKAAPVTPEPDKASDATDAKAGADAIGKDASGMLGTIGSEADKVVADGARMVGEVVADQTKELAAQLDKSAPVIDENAKDIEQAAAKVGEASTQNWIQGAEALKQFSDPNSDEGTLGRLGDLGDDAIQLGIDGTGRVIGAAGELIGTAAGGLAEDLGEVGKVVDSLPFTPSGEGAVKGLVKGATNSFITAQGSAAAIAGQVEKNNESMGEFYADTAKKLDEGAQRQREATVKLFAGEGGWLGRSGDYLDATIDNQLKSVGDAASIGTDYVTRQVQANVDTASTVVNEVGKNIGAGFQAVGDFFGGMFGGGDKSADSADDKESEPAPSAPVNSDGKSKAQIEHEEQLELNRRAKDGAGIEASASSSSTPNKAQIEHDEAVAAEQATQSPTNASPNAIDHQAETEVKPSPNAVDHQVEADAAKAAADAATAKAADAANPAKPVDYTQPDARAAVIAQAQQAQLVPVGATFDANGAAVYEVKDGDHYWGITQQVTGTDNTNFNYDYWNQLQAANGSPSNGALYPGDKIVLPGRSIEDLVRLLGLQK